MSLPSASYSITMRLDVTPGPLAIGRMTAVAPAVADAVRRAVEAAADTDALVPLGDAQPSAVVPSATGSR